VVSALAAGIFAARFADATRWLAVFAGGTLDWLALPGCPVAERAGRAGCGAGTLVLKEIHKHDGRGERQLNDTPAFERDLVQLGPAAVVEHNHRKAGYYIINARNAKEPGKLVGAEGKRFPGEARWP
jgi:hypothetical protein